MTRQEIADIISQTVEITVRRIVKELIPTNDEISVRKAEELYGRAEIRALIRDNKIRTRRTGSARNSKIVLSRSEILTALAGHTAL